MAYTQVSVTVNKQGYYEIRNGIAGIVIARQQDVPNSQWLAPVQSFIYADGAYSDNTTNYLLSPTPPVSLRTTILSSSKEEVVAEVMYRFQKKQFEFYGRKFAGGEAGEGFYRFLVTVKNNEKSIVIEEDTNYDISYAVKISHGLAPNHARYRGWASETIEGGYEKPGVIYRPEDTRGYPMDATVDFDYKKPYVNYPLLTLWEPAGGEYNSGRYWQVYNSNDGANGNLFGFFQGKPSRLLGAIHIGPHLRTFPDEGAGGEKNVADILISIERLAPDVSWVQRKRFQWVAFISQRKDVLPPEMSQPIGKELNRISGLGAVVNAYASKPAKLTAAFYSGAVYMDGAKIEALCKNVKTDKALYEKLIAIDGTYKPIWDAWHNADSARSLIKLLVTVADEMPDLYNNKEGTYTADYRYWKGARNFKFYALCISCLFADKTNFIAAADKKKLEQLVVLMARILWDDNNVPFFDSSKVNTGPNNMAFQYQNTGRMFFALLLADAPEFSQRAKEARSIVTANIQSAIYKNGASFGTPHYTQATIDPILFSMLQLKQAGVVNLFADKKIRDFAGFYSSLVTPPSCRFMNNRKLISFGDGSEESCATFGLLSTGLNDIDPSFSNRLRSLYFFGPLRSSFAGPVPLAIEFSSVPAKSFEAGSCNYSGYMSHFRSAVNTNYESAVWVLNGDSLYDHRNDDAGETAIYALNAPLSLSRSSFYYPSATDSRIRSVVVPANMFPEWNSDKQPIAGRSLVNRTWPASSLQEFASLGYSNSATVKMKMVNGKTWYRKLTMITIENTLPVIVFYDSLPGNEPAIWSLPMMSEGAIATPAGNITPEKRIDNNNDVKQLPAATGTATLHEGLNRFTFTGQNWPAHFSGGINWHLYTCSKAKMDVSLADWGTVWQNSEEQNEFLSTNSKPFKETQQFIRLRSSLPFFNVLLPYNKKTNPYAGGVEQIGASTLLIKQNDRELVVNPDYFYTRTSGNFIAALLSVNGNFSSQNYFISGGYTEVVLQKDTFTIRIHGNSGKRKIVAPLQVVPVRKYAEVSLTGSTSNTIFSIEYINNSLDLPNGQKGYKEYVFTVK